MSSSRGPSGAGRLVECAVPGGSPLLRSCLYERRCRFPARAGGGAVSCCGGRLMVRTCRRVARRAHRCGCGQRIAVGVVYLSMVLSPDHDGLGNRGWLRVAECAGCAARYGRAEFLEKGSR